MINNYYNNKKYSTKTNKLIKLLYKIKIHIRFSDSIKPNIKSW